mmetsp:Transcript_118395/g.317562  ORF Transcript_118395/g.317562 Transcript_118395/m.317562 type:complete len:200 (+) Transcript_118395:240-839(+)
MGLKMGMRLEFGTSVLNPLCTFIRIPTDPRCRIPSLSENAPTVAAWAAIRALIVMAPARSSAQIVMAKREPGAPTVMAKGGNGAVSAKAKVNVGALGAKVAVRHATRAVPRAESRAMSAVAVERVEGKAEARAKETTLRPPRWSRADVTSVAEKDCSSALCARGKNRCTATHARKELLNVTRAKERSGHSAVSAKEKSG